MSSEFSDFAFEDTSSVDRIFISDVEGISADLTRQKDNTWKINDEYKARQDAIDLILKSVNSIKVKETVPKSTMETIIKSMAGNSIKVEIYSGSDKPVKVYYVGNPTQNHFGTYMLLEIDGEKSSTPFITHMPGFHGFLTARFFTDEDKWRDRTVFAYKAEDIKSIQISYQRRPLKSFKITREDSGFSVIDLNSRTKIDPLKEEAIDEYMSRFESIHYEFIQREAPLANIDSVTSTTPLHIIEVEGIDGRKTLVKTYNKPITGSIAVNPATGKAYTVDLDRLYAWVNDTDFVVMQWPTLDNILAYYDDFRRSEIVDN
jgi:hypothetical protein